MWERLCDQQKAVVIETITGILTQAALAQDPKGKADERLRLVERAGEPGWPRDPVIVVDADPGLSGAGFTHRSGFARRLTEVVLGQVGIILGLEVSRRARNHADWRRRLDFCGMTDTLNGFDRKVCRFPCSSMMRSHGQLQLTLRSTTYLRIRCMLALTFMVRPGTNAMSTNQVILRSDPVTYPSMNGVCYFQIITSDLLTGQLIRLIQSVWTATRIRNPIREVVR